MSEHRYTIKRGADVAYAETREAAFLAAATLIDDAAAGDHEPALYGAHITDHAAAKGELDQWSVMTRREPAA